MAVFRVERNRGYTVMSNHHLRNKELSLAELAALKFEVLQKVGEAVGNIQTYQL